MINGQLSLAARTDWVAHVFKAITQQHHREMEGVFRPYIKPDAVIFDVGAHAGQFAKLFAKMAPRGQVFAFEPSAYARSILSPAIGCSGLRNIEILSFGLSDTVEQRTMTTPIKKRGGVGFGLAHLGGDESGMVQTVALKTLDGFVKERGLNRLDFLKIDIEGWEVHALRGGANTIARDRPAIFIEANEAALARAGSSPAQIWDILSRCNYRALMAPTFTPASAFNGASDYLFVQG